MNGSKRPLAILGTGNIGWAIARGLVKAGLYEPGEIRLTRRSEAALSDLSAQGYAAGTDNVRAVNGAALVILAVTPQQLNGLLLEIRGAVDPAKHTLISVVSGATIAAIRERLGSDVTVIRAMPNTAISIQESMTCISAAGADPGAVEEVQRLFDALGMTLVIPESHMIPATALCACGIAFFLRAIRAASRGGSRSGSTPKRRSGWPRRRPEGLHRFSARPIAIPKARSTVSRRRRAAPSRA